MLCLVLRQPGKRTAHWIGKDRRRPRRLPDEELKVDITLDDAGAFVVTVTHLPTQVSTTESAPTRGPALRRAQERVAAMVAELPDRQEPNVA
jgi:hypothetical protein